jgi:hypothetical protein
MQDVTMRRLCASLLTILLIGFAVLAAAAEPTGPVPASPSMTPRGAGR